MRALLLATTLLFAGCIGPAAPPPLDPAPPQEAPPAPYAGEEVREIKALSPQEIEDYLQGAGLGYAKPAELNSYPGPLHALEMAERLGLTQEQHDEITRIRAHMLSQAVPLGERYLQVEASIERAFREGDIDGPRLKALLDESAAIEAQLRYAHLDAHLATRALLTPHQVALYDEARGYGTADHGAHEH